MSAMKKLPEGCYGDGTFGHRIGEKTMIMCDSCGKECVAKGFGAGYGVTSDGRKHCDACCAIKDIESMVDTGRLVGYLDAFGNVTNWPGTLRIKPSKTRKGKHNIGGTRTDVWFLAQDGTRFHGVHIGDGNTIVRCKRVKG